MRWFAAVRSPSFALAVTLATLVGLALAPVSREALWEWEWEWLSDFAEAGSDLDVAALQPLVIPPPRPGNWAIWAEALGRQFAGLPGIARVNVRDRGATVLWSTSPDPVSPAAPSASSLDSVGGGRLTGRPSNPDLVDRPRPLMILATAYLPVLSAQSGEVLGVLELDKAPGRLRQSAMRAQFVTWVLAFAVGALTFVAVQPLWRRPAAGRPLADFAAPVSSPPPVPVTLVVAPAPAVSAAPAGATALPPREPGRGSGTVEGVPPLPAERLRTLGEIAGGVAHDVNNVLGVILGRIHLLMSRTERRDDAELRRQLQLIEQVALDGTRTVRRILEFTRGFRSDASPGLDVGQVVRDVIELTGWRWREEVTARSVSYDVRVDTSPGLLAAADPSELRGVLTNLVFNAVDAMPTGGRLALATWADGGSVICTVADTGIGMTEEVSRRVFEPLFTTKGKKGTGLGLSVARALITARGGDISVDSLPGQGTTFTIRLPRVLDRPRP